MLAALAEASGPMANSNRAEDLEEVMPVDSVDSAIQHMVSDAGQRVITIVTDQHGNLQSGSLGQQFYVTMQSGQQTSPCVESFCHNKAQGCIPKKLKNRHDCSASQITEEVVEEEVQPPPACKRRLSLTVSHTEPKVKEPTEKNSRELLPKQLQEANRKNRKAHEHRQQLLQKEQEAEHCRIRLEAIAHSQTNGTGPAEESRGERDELGGEEVLLSEGAIIIKAEELDPSEQEEVKLVETVEATSAHLEVTL